MYSGRPHTSRRHGPPAKHRHCITCCPATAHSTDTLHIHWESKGNNSKGQGLSEQVVCVSSGHEFTHVSCHPNSLRFSKTRTTRCDIDNTPHFSNIHFNIITDIYAQICQVHTFLRNLRPKLCTHFISPLRVLHDLPIELQESELWNSLRNLCRILIFLTVNPTHSS